MSGIDDISIPDEYPARPSNIVKTEILRVNSVKEKKNIYATVLLSITYFIFGIGIGFYGPLYSLKAEFHRVPSYLYGPAISCNFFVALLFYPVASRMVSSLTCKLSAFLGIFMIGYCRILFGTLHLMPGKLSFILLSFAIQILEGIGIALLLVSTFIILFSANTDKPNRNKVWIMVSSIVGYSIGPICGEAIYEAFGFSVLFYGLGVLTTLDAIITGVILPEPGQKITYKEIPIVSWMKDSTLLIYLFIIFTTFNYTGFLAVILEPFLRQFHLDRIFFGVLFSVPALACGITAPGWLWVTKKGVNSLLLSCFACILVIASLVLIVPASFTTLDVSLTNISVALLLQGIGSGGKLACIVFAAERDLKTKRVENGAIEQSPLIIPTVFAFGAFAGYFSGSFITGFTFYYFGMAISSYVLYAFEALTISAAFIFAFKRNYRSPRRVLKTDERQPIIGS